MLKINLNKNLKEFVEKEWKAKIHFSDRMSSQTNDKGIFTGNKETIASTFINKSFTVGKSDKFEINIYLIHRSYLISSLSEEDEAIITDSYLAEECEEQNLQTSINKVNNLILRISKLMNENSELKDFRRLGRNFRK